MKILHNLKVGSIIFVVLAVGIVLGVVVVKPKQKVISAVIDGVIAYTDGSAEIIINDSPDVYRAEMSAILRKDDFHPTQTWFVPPRLVPQGGAWQRVAYTYSDSLDSDCQNHIFYMDRIKKEAKVFRLDYCVKNTLDEHDITRFLAMSPDAMSLAVGSYEDGKILTTTTIPNQLTYSYYCFSGPYPYQECYYGAVSNWEMTKMIFPAGLCGYDGGYSDTEEIKTLRIFEWDIQKGIVEDITPKGFDCNQYSELFYNHSKEPFNLKSDTFYLRLQDGKEIAL